ncbi:hypothetical protein QYF36_018598 [Acer negundo]|nr:hypothetical protein QYF36_018598 [Acer negundo]
MGPLRKRPKERLSGVKGSDSLNMSGFSTGTSSAFFTSMFISYLSNFSLATLDEWLETFAEKLKSTHSPEDYSL